MSDEPDTKWNVQNRFEKKHISSIEVSTEETEDSTLESMVVSDSTSAVGKSPLDPRAWFGQLVARYRRSK